MLCSLETCPLTEHLCEKLDVVQRKMMRKMIGWHFVAGDDWETGGRRMKYRLQRCTDQIGIKNWSVQVNERKHKVLAYPNDENHWMYRSIRWYPPCCDHLNSFHCVRARGHPYTKWYDGIRRSPASVIEVPISARASSVPFFNNFVVSSDSWW